jgi:hypothetical protein
VVTVLEDARRRAGGPSAREKPLDVARRLAGAHAARCPAAIGRGTVAVPPQLLKFKLVFQITFKFV